jgi:hypothetical protein
LEALRQSNNLLDRAIVIRLGGLRAPGPHEQERTMDGLRFDRFTKTFARSSRRSFLKTALGAALGGVLAARPGDGEAAACKATGQVCREHANCCSGHCGEKDATGRHRCACPKGTTDCSDKCVKKTAFTSDTANCGACSNACPRTRCQIGACTGGVCGLAPDPNAVGKSCDDGIPCTIDDVCQPDGSCAGIPVTCAAADQCHQTGVCQQATGQCTSADQPDGTSCNDGNSCTQTDTCQAGQCVGGNPVQCPQPTTCQVSVACDPATGKCVAVNQPDGTLCGADNACSHDVCLSGVCTTNVPKDAGIACNDANSCTQTDACDGRGTCVGGAPVVCVAADTCHAQGTCDEATGSCGDHPQLPGTCFVGGLCYNTNDPNPDNPCEHCDPAASATGFSPLPDDTACDDGDKCTTDDVCRSGVCAGTPVVCAPLDPCHVAGTCDPATGACANPNATDGTDCDDGDAATCNDACQSGVCTGEPCAGVCSPTQPCPSGQECCGSQCYDPATGLQCRSTCFLGPFGAIVPLSRSDGATCGPEPNYAEFPDDPRDTFACDAGTCRDDQLICPWPQEFLDGACRFPCGGGYCGDGEACCANSTCCNFTTQRCQLIPTVQCVEVCPGGTDKCGGPAGECCSSLQTCVGSVCKNNCGPTTCFQGDTCCGSFCCDSATEACGATLCVPKAICTGTQVYLPSINTCCDPGSVCGERACCAADETCLDSDSGLCLSSG